MSVEMSSSSFDTCPVCGAHVNKPGEFDTWVCWLHWHAVMQMREVDIVELEDYVELHNQPWYKEYVNAGT